MDENEEENEGEGGKDGGRKMRGGGGRKRGRELEQTGTNVPSLITLVIHLTT